MIEKPVIQRYLATINDINIFYRDTCSENQTILCLHGRWGRGETWTDFMSRYGDKYRIIAPDQRGHGLSDKPETGYHMKDFARDAQELLSHVGTFPAILVGHSMGARVAGYVAALYPEIVRALILLDENAEGAESQIKSDVDEIRDPFDDGLTRNWPVPFKSVAEATKYLSSSFKRETNVRYFLDSLTEDITGYDFMFSRRAMATIGRSYESWYHLLPQIKCPVLLVRAEQSWCLSRNGAQKMRSLLKNCTYFEVPESDHMVYVDNNENFYPKFDEFLKSL